jgi:hypothetical protein
MTQTTDGRATPSVEAGELAERLRRVRERSEELRRRL